EADAALLHQHHDRTRDEDLGVREGTEDVVRPEFGPCLAVRPADTLLVDDIAPAQDRPGDARKNLLIHIALHRRAHVGKTTGFCVHVPTPWHFVRHIATIRAWEACTIARQPNQ